MPLPLGHTAIGLATYEVCTNASGFARWKQLLFIVVLANLPDVDVLIGLIVQWNGQAYHRGATHSLLFALAAGYAASRLAKWWRMAPRWGFYPCVLLISSHIVADALLTASPVSFWWPIEIYYSTGHAGWSDVLHTVLFDGLQDAGVLVVCALILLGRRLPAGFRLRRRLRRMFRSLGPGQPPPV